ncbi:uncharacterized protein Z518_10530 [Rhinocladiella mackenziei CBS 650.93]|uniref:Xylanolytic transcriptional activator regulatory domain-containing protein n=1 Tax=Rhinocladiella mackenziei CBS 650.93 TaxID=1442369 RepID=A0A0D2IAU1_9EURO|nr:uncharacterized protein Z518_10530 [Rhinocladiella mackenziei CBS 650.93]KIX00391.1 hypothetical protein Z518_10530 [Rhinocladiella mackenziei CBS 650.93]
MRLQTSWRCAQAKEWRERDFPGFGIDRLEARESQPGESKDNDNREIIQPLSVSSGRQSPGTIASPSQDKQSVAWEDEEVLEQRMQEGQVSNIGTPRLAGVNTHTSGTEFYGSSSNLAFLARLFSKARKRVTTLSHDGPSVNVRNDASSVQDATSELRHLNDNRSSLVDLMYSIDYHSPVNGATRSQKDVTSTPNASIGTPSIRTNHSTPGQIGANAPPIAPSVPSLIARYPSSASRTQSNVGKNFETFEVEKIFVDAYFHNKHYIHPMLTEKSFRERCVRDIWTDRPTASPLGRRTQFLALYYAVVALGAINCGVEQTSSLAQYSPPDNEDDRPGPPTTKRSTLEWASHYFGLAKQTLSDTMEISSLETCQTLFLMTVFCQNALKPHACYMYSGHAVRTAIAIGLANNSRKTCTEENKRTWWCIYSHEIEMCTSSGRLDSLMPPDLYSLPMPEWTVDGNENPDIAIIRVMVDLSRILKKVSVDLYCNSEDRPMSELSQMGLKLNEELALWKANLPTFLNFDVESLDDALWAYKQKVVLKMRFYNARILINRPFIVASYPGHHVSEFSQHVDICLDAARKTIQLIHNAFINRMYLRTWWYCTTYTLYASMIVLYLILVDYPTIRGEELISDVEKSLEIFSAMRQVVVARRCAELTKEMLTVAKIHQQGLRQRQNMGQEWIPQASSALETRNDNYLTTILNQSLPGWDKAGALAHLYDPSVLEDFALSGGEYTGSVDVMMDFSANLWDDIEQTGPMWGIFEPFQKGDTMAGNEQAGWT